ncbi:MAG: hypothetical protein KatS3mg131_1409 [Candidatus Tectimicrobiota bacterium]|nr:MAG: hypothetical protein KatS3mg131_1409 [Candidatus Tectomicrobia bacterium]
MLGITAFIALLLMAGGIAAQAPPLPPGREGLPVEPALPPGLGSPAGPQKATAPLRPALPFVLAGFGEARLGLRTQEDPHEKDVSLGEVRVQVQLEKAWERVTARLSSDFLFDAVLDRHAVDLEAGEGAVDLREAHLLLRPVAFLDVKVGRQILTWGTGDLVFINDLFPKDFNALFLGRDPEYLKAPSDALKLSLFTPVVNLDVVYTPRFDPDRFLDGRRLSFFNPQLGRRAGRDAVMQVDRPAAWFVDSELAWRVYRTVAGYELALYGYRGFWKSPVGFDPATARATFPPLAVYGASVRGAVAGGIGYLEVGYYDSEDDRRGDDPLVPNRELRLLLGHERELRRNLTVGVQYFLQRMLQHEAFRRTLPPGSPDPGAYRHLLTVRLTQLLWQQTLRLSLFAFYSPSDADAYLRPRAHYALNDHWSVELGANLFVGAKAHTFFGQLSDNSNLYAGVRYSF